MITAVEFCERYIEWLEEIDHVIDALYYPAIRKMYMKPPQDIITPEACFADESHAIGFIWRLLVKTHKDMQKGIDNAAAAK